MKVPSAEANRSSAEMLNISIVRRLGISIGQSTYRRLIRLSRQY